MRRLLFALTTAVLGCQPDVVKWEEPRRITGGIDGRNALLVQGTSPIFVDPVLAAGAFTPPNACPGSLRFTRAAGQEMHAVWWAVRPDGTASLLSSRSDDGGTTWNPPVPVDTTDVSRTGCNRPAPAIAADTSSAYIHVVYALENAAGSGIFFSHSMERGELFHAPVAIVYGESPRTADVAADRDRVVVAYEDPNFREQSPGRIALAISRTSGHIFEHREPVNTGTAAVAAPRVAISGDRIAVSWIESPRAIAGEQYRVVRVGRLQGSEKPAPPAVIDSQFHPAGHTGAVPAKP